jgi:hypothetical protein
MISISSPSKPLKGTKKNRIAAADHIRLRVTGVRVSSTRVGIASCATCTRRQASAFRQPAIKKSSFDVLWLLAAITERRLLGA